MGTAAAPPTVIPADPFTVIPAQAGIRRRRDSNGLVFSVPFGIPAYAGMTVGGPPGYSTPAARQCPFPIPRIAAAAANSFPLILNLLKDAQPTRAH